MSNLSLNLNNYLLSSLYNSNLSNGANSTANNTGSIFGNNLNLFDNNSNNLLNSNSIDNNSNSFFASLIDLLTNQERSTTASITPSTATSAANTSSTFDPTEASKAAITNSKIPLNNSDSFLENIMFKDQKEVVNREYKATKGIGGGFYIHDYYADGGKTSTHYSDGYRLSQTYDSNGKRIETASSTLENPNSSHFANYDPDTKRQTGYGQIFVPKDNSNYNFKSRITTNNTKDHSKTVLQDYGTYKMIKTSVPGEKDSFKYIYNDDPEIDKLIPRNSKGKISYEKKLTGTILGSGTKGVEKHYEVTTYNNKGEKIVRQESEGGGNIKEQVFNTKGQMISSKFIVNGKQIIASNATYNEKGQVISSKSVDENGKVKASSVNSYNDKGEVTEQAFFDKDGKSLGKKDQASIDFINKQNKEQAEAKAAKGPKPAKEFSGKAEADAATKNDPTVQSMIKTSTGSYAVLYKSNYQKNPIIKDQTKATEDYVNKSLAQAS